MRFAVWALVILRIRNVDNWKLSSITWIDVGSEILDELIDVGAFVCVVQVVAEPDLVLPSGLRLVVIRAIQSTETIDGCERNVAVLIDRCPEIRRQSIIPAEVGALSANVSGVGKLGKCQNSIPWRLHDLSFTSTHCFTYLAFPSLSNQVCPVSPPSNKGREA